MPLTVGTRLGVYEISDALGAGGMGEVYRARDTKLGRGVAIKVLPDTVAGDAERVARFEREARALAALNHPHIAALFGMEEAAGRHFLVMELVEGETLEQRLARPRARMTVAEALRIARQIAEALEAAHEKGIIHRDLKPANVKVTPDDKIKVLDFGLAKAIEGTATRDGRADSATHSVMGTEAGVILGTASYMSPEQARAKPVDRRADIWAFGCVLYEMLTGKRAFATGESVSDAIAAILTAEVDWSALPAETPPHIRGLLRRCLQKDPQRRLPHIGVARLEIDHDGEDAAPEAGTLLRPAPLAKRAVSIAITALAAGAVAASAAWMLKPESAPGVARFSIVLPDGQAFTNTGRQAIAISPDGQQIVYVANRRLYLRSVRDQEPRAIAGTDHDQGVFQPVFSPDGRSLAFVAGFELKRIALSGGTAATIASLNRGVYGMSWFGDHLVFGEGGTRIVRVPVAGGTPEVLVTVETPEAVASPWILPDGDHLLYSHARLTNPSERWTKAQVVAQSLRTGERTVIVDGGADGRFLANGYLLYAVGGVVYGAPLDVDRLVMRGTPAPLIEGVRRGGPTGAAQFATSTMGSLAFLPGTASSPSESELFLTDPKGNTVRLNIRGGQYQQPRLSPDGKHLAFGSVDPRVATVWVYELSGASAMRRLTIDGNNKFPVWSADGQRVIFQSDREGDLALFWQRADGTGAAERLTRPGQGTAHLPHASSPDGRHLLYSALDGRALTLWIHSFDDGKTGQVDGVTSQNPLGATFSPDGRSVAYYAKASAADRVSRVYVMPFPPTGTKYEIGTGVHPMWSADGQQLFMPRTQGRMGAIRISTQPTFTFGDAIETSVRAIGATGDDWPRAFDIGRDGTMVGVITAGNLEALNDNREIRVVLNWFQEFPLQKP